MATTLFLLSGRATVHRGSDSADLVGGASAWSPLPLSTSRGSGATTGTRNTVAGTTPGIEILDTATANAPSEWISDPVSADVTISGTITANIWAFESNMSANVAINVVIDIIRCTDNSIVNIVKSTRTTEVAVTTSAVNNFTTGMTSGSYTGQTLNKGDRLRIRVFGDDAGTMASGFTFSVDYSGTTGGATGDTFVTFTETFSFMSLSNPAGSTLYLRDTASDVVTASVDREAWTTQGSTSSVTDVTNTTAGWADVQITDTAGGTVVDWFSKQLTAFTLTGLAKANLRWLESVASTRASARCEIARVDSDGTNPSIWASWCLDPSLAASVATAGELSTTNRAETFWLSGDDLAFSDGQRIRIRLYMDTAGQNLSGRIAGRTITLGYDDGTGTNGDSFVIFPQTLTEFVVSAPETDAPKTYLEAVRHSNTW